MTNQTDRVRRNTTFAVVERIRAIEDHIDPRVTRVEVIELTSGIRLVTGRHYRVGDRGVYLRPGCLIPGWLAEQLWLVGKKRASAWFEVRMIPIGIKDAPPELKVNSPGLWCGEWYKNDKTTESLEHEAEWGREVDAEGFVHWRFWRPEWREGFTLDGHFGIVEAELPPEIPFKHDPAFVAKKHYVKHARVAHREERRLFKSEVAVPGGIAEGRTGDAPGGTEVSSTPAAGSLSQRDPGDETTSASG